ncbi:transmembrane protein 25 isoform X3 [Phyllopteryx taeniolatus]|uniref:transmembrane protein 25 isoform X3 n=1 Tax=Phyllopteryx taeniolatus TaxID=161469 RepID=UPI002AD27B27|nr:transmembrane protein 25 isoform X3 [Phyllopteryx taeniolatus]
MHVCCSSMDNVCKRRWSSGSQAMVFLHTLALSWAGAVEPAPEIDGHRQTAMTLRENAIHRFNCHSYGWHPHAPALLTWYLNVQPEILRVSAHSSENSDPGLLLVLFALVQSNPPATFTFTDQSGLLMANTSDIFILDSHDYPWMTNHTLRVTLSSLSGNISLNASNSVGTTQSNLTLAEFLQSRVEVPMLGIVTGGSMAFMALLILSLIVLCLMQKPTSKSIDEPVEILMTKKSDSTNLKAERSYIPRENMSLPSNMQLNDLSTLKKGENIQQISGGEKKKDEEDEDLSLAYAARGFARYPMVGYIYKVNSTSSEEIWL